MNVRHSLSLQWRNGANMFPVMKLVTNSFICRTTWWWVPCNAASGLWLVTQSKLCPQFQSVPFLGKLFLKWNTFFSFMLHIFGSIYENCTYFHDMLSYSLTCRRLSTSSTPGVTNLHLWSRETISAQPQRSVGWSLFLNLTHFTRLLCMLNGTQLPSIPWGKDNRDVCLKKINTNSLYPM